MLPQIRIWVPLGWFATAALCFGLGFAVSDIGSEEPVDRSGSANLPASDRPAPSKPTSWAEQTDLAEDALEGSFGEEATDTLTDEIPEALPYGGYATFREYLRAAFNEPNDLRRTGMLAELLSTLGPENLPAVLAMYESMPNRGWESIREWNMLMYAWGQFDGASAVAYARENMGGRRGGYLTAAAMRSWASVNPQAALEWKESAGSTGGPGDFFLNAALISGFAQNDPAAAAAYVTAMDAGPQRQRLTGVLVNEYLKQGYGSATGWAQSLSDPSLKTEAYTEIMRRWARDDVDAAARWLTPQLDQPFASAAAAELAGEMAETNPAGALDLVYSMPEGEARDEALAETLEEWAERDPEAAALWLDEQPIAPATDLAVAAYAREVARLDPTAAMDWAQTIYDDNQRQSAIFETAVTWMRQDPTAATAWMQANDYSEAEQQAILERSVQRGNRRFRGR